MLRIREIRRAQKITAKELANLVNVAESTMCLYETGKREPDFRTLLEIAEQLNVSIDDLFGRSDKNTDAKKGIIMDNLLILRNQKGITQKDMADFLGISRQAYANYETGNREPDLTTLKRIAEYFNVTVEYLLGNSELPQTTHENNADLNLRTEQEKTLIRVFRETTEEGRLRIIQTVLNICDEIKLAELTGTDSSSAV